MEGALCLVESNGPGDRWLVWVVKRKPDFVRILLRFEENHRMIDA
jgi:hypothetical protein